MNRFEHAPREILDQLADYERALTSAPINTLRNIHQVAQYVGFDNQQKFSNYLKRRTILDLGSGYCGLAIEAYLAGISQRVISVNPASRQSSFEDHRWLQLLKKDPIFHYPIAQIEAALRHVNRLTYPAFAHNLAFPNFFFDLVIDNWAVSLYANEDHRPFYQAALLETIRVLKPGGVMLIGDPENKNHWKREAIMEICRQQRVAIQPIEYPRLDIQTGWKITA